MGTETLDSSISDGNPTATSTFTLEVAVAQQVPAVPTLGTRGAIVLAVLMVLTGVLIIGLRKV